MNDFRSISSILTNYENFFILQDYHRGYSWQSKHIVQLLRDIDSVVIEKNDSYLYLSSIYYIKRENNNKEIYLELIDGYQRIATIMLILREIINRVRNENPENSNFEKFEMGLFDRGNNNKIRLTPYFYNDSNNFFINYITTGKVNLKLNQNTDSLASELALINSIALIKNFLSHEKIEFWGGFTKKLIERTSVNMIELSSNVNATEVYRSLNSKGMILDNTL